MPAGTFKSGEIGDNRLLVMAALSTEHMGPGRGFAMAGFDLATTLTDQMFLLTYPQGELRRITNDFNSYAGVTAGGGDVALASTRTTALSNLYAIDTSSGKPLPLTKTASPENSPLGLAVMGDRVFYSTLHNDFLGVSTVPLAGGEPTALETGNGHITLLRAAGGKIVMQRIDADLWQGVDARVSTFVEHSFVDDSFHSMGLSGKSESFSRRNRRAYSLGGTVGWGPVDDPKFLVYIWLEKPSSSIWGSQVAAPVFKEVVERLVVLLNIPPDRPAFTDLPTAAPEMIIVGGRLQVSSFRMIP